jgi:hypothetical protein
MLAECAWNSSGHLQRRMRAVYVYMYLPHKTDSSKYFLETTEQVGQVLAILTCGNARFEPRKENRLHSVTFLAIFLRILRQILRYYF